ncbi:Alpha/Beta hydrolase protein [Xylariales sp. PMI_506]|nr:Alpha/Beta hydrolase protein [Xylariales sp. PMI_506]
MGLEFPEGDLLTLPDGRSLCYSIYGDRNATKTIFLQHGLPGSHLEGLGYEEPGQKHGIRVIAIDRPGMGGSTFQPGRRLLDAPADILALADHLGVDRFCVVGHSGGGPYALACLHTLPRTRCVGAGVVAGMYPVALGTGDMLFQNKLLLAAARWATWLVEKGFDWEMGNLARDTAHPERVDEMLDKSFRNKPGVDQAAWAEDVEGRTILAEDMRRSLRDSSRGAAWESYILSTDWGFCLEDIKEAPGNLVIWHGAQDINAPASMARKAAVLMPWADARILEDEGHLSVSFHKRDEVLEAMNAMLSG